MGLRLRGQKADARKITLYLTLISGFTFGGIAGSLAFVKMQFSAMLIPSVFTAFIAVGYWLYLYYLQSNAKS
jgi:uncharacterized membrane protein YoaK (UPF0700 family)